MNQHNKLIEEYWQSFLNQTAANETVLQAGYQAWAFGSTPEVADELVSLVLKGVKTATASLVWSYEAEGESPAGRRRIQYRPRWPRLAGVHHRTTGFQ